MYVILVYVFQTFRRRSMEKHTSQSYEEALMEFGLIFHELWEYFKQDYIHLCFYWKFMYFVLKLTYLDIFVAFTNLWNFFHHFILSNKHRNISINLKDLELNYVSFLFTYSTWKVCLYWKRRHDVKSFHTIFHTIKCFTYWRRSGIFVLLLTLND